MGDDRRVNALDVREEIKGEVGNEVVEYQKSAREQAYDYVLARLREQRQSLDDTIAMVEGARDSFTVVDVSRCPAIITHLKHRD